MIALPSIFGCRPFSFSTWITLCLSLLACKVFCWKVCYSLWGVPLFITGCFPLIAFIFFFVILITVCLGVVLFQLILICVLPGLGCLFPFPGSGSFQLLSHQVSFFLLSLCLSSTYETAMMWISLFLMLSCRSLKLSSFLKILFSVQLKWFPLTLSSSSLIPLSVWTNLLLIPSGVFFPFSCCVLQLCLAIFYELGRIQTGSSSKEN